jgi:hypothetical protein
MQLVEIEDKLDLEQEGAKERIRDLEKELLNRQETYESQTKYLQQRLCDLVQDTNSQLGKKHKPTQPIVAQL